MIGHPVLVGRDAIRGPLGMVGGEFAGDGEAGLCENGSLGAVFAIGEVAIAVGLKQGHVAQAVEEGLGVVVPDAAPGVGGVLRQDGRVRC